MWFNAGFVGNLLLVTKLTKVGRAQQSDIYVLESMYSSNLLDNDNL